MRHIWTVICEGSLIDEETKNISLINVIEQLNFELQDDIPSDVILKLHIVSLIARSHADITEKGEIKYQFELPNQELIDWHTFEIAFENYSRIRVRMVIPVLPFRGYGIYSVIVSLKSENDWNKVATIPLEIKFNGASAR
jgi:hypothetical protein